MGDLTTRLLINLGGNLPGKSRAFARSLDRFSRDGQRSLGRLRRGSIALGRGIDRLGNRYLALATGAGAIAAARSTINLQRRFTRLGIQANISADKVEGLKRRIFEVSQQGDIRIDPSELTSAVETIVEKTGDLAFAEENLENLARAVQATGGSGTALGALTAEFKKFGIESNAEIAELLDTLAAQGKEGAFTLGNMASQGERLASAYAATGRQGPKAVREMGAVIQVIRQGTGSAEMAATAFEAVLRTLQDAAKVKLLQGAGIEIFEPDQPGVMRAVNEIMTDIIEKAGGDTLKISQIFDAEAMRAFNSSIGEFKRIGAVESFDEFLKVQGDGTQIMADSQRAADDMAGAVQGLSTAWAQFADGNLAKPIQDLAGALNSVEPGRLQELLETAKNVGLGFGGLLLARKLGVGKAIGFGARKLFGKGKGAGAGASGGLLPGLGGGAGGAGAAPVFVTNWPGGFGGGAGAGAGRGGRRGGSTIGRFAGGGAGAGVSRLARAGGAARLGLRGSAPLLALMSLFNLGSTLADSSLSRDQKIVGSGRAVGGLGGGLTGAAAGAALGSVVPIVGTVVGGIIGAALGSFGGESLGETIARLITEKGGGAAREPVEARRTEPLQGKLEIDIRGAPPGTRVGPVVSSNRDLDFDVNVGMAMAGS